MNIFENQEVFFGELPIDRLATAYLEFFALAGDIRLQLGRSAYLLDEYITQLFAAIEDANATDTNLGGPGNMTCLLAICRAAQQPDGDIPHPFFTTARNFIQSHPLDFMDAHTKAWLYIAMLANDYIKSTVQAYKQEFFAIADEHFDIGSLQSQCRNIKKLLGTEAPLEKLNLLFKERFLAVPALSAFYRELNNEVLEALTPRDPETALQIFQLLINNKYLDQTVPTK